MALDTEGDAPLDPGSSRREALEAAFDAAEAPAEAAPSSPTPEPVYAPPETAEPAPEAKEETAAERRARDEKGRFSQKAVAPGSAAPKGTVKATPGKPGEVKAGLPPGVSLKAPAPADQPKPEALKPPASWKPAAREQWAKLPAEVQQETVRREREAQATLQESAEARRSWGAFQQAVAPYVGMLQAEGSNPVQAAASLFQTAQALRTAPPQHKAQLVARMVQDYGIDIRMLDAALAGQAPQGEPQGQQQFRDPRFDELMARVQSGERQRQQSVSQKAAQEVQEFSQGAEFFEDVRQDMADLLEVAARRGVALTPQEAYNRAVKLNPEISGVLSQREQAKAANASTASTQRSRAAAASVKSRPAGPTSSPAPTGRRGALEAAWDAVNH